MVRIRLKRIGRRNQPYYRIVVADARSPRDGKVIEELGSYNPREVDWEKKVVLKNEKDEEGRKKTVDKIYWWYKNGAQPTNTVYHILAKKGIVLKPEIRKTKSNNS